jgi:transposase InsO family protein
LEQDFTATAPNQRWSPISLPTDEGWLFLADHRSRPGIVGWAMQLTMQLRLILRRFHHGGVTGSLSAHHTGLIHHSDRGSHARASINNNAAPSPPTA